jgi:hypothetical protein
MKRQGKTVTYVLVDETGEYMTDCGPLLWGGDPVEMRFKSLADARAIKRDLDPRGNSIEIIKETVEAVG